MAFGKFVHSDWELMDKNKKTKTKQKQSTTQQQLTRKVEYADGEKRHGHYALA